MRKSANKQQSQVQTIGKTAASRNVTKVNGNINSGKAVTNFVVTAMGTSNIHQENICLETCICV